VPRRSHSRSPTLKQVARLARVSIKTVSRVLNSGAYVSDRTRRRVTRAIGQLGYRPNVLARGLVTGRSRSIGLVIADIVNPFFPPLVRAVEDVAAARGYNLILCDTDEDPVREREVISALLERQVDGLILCASRAPRSELVRLARDARHVVLVNRVISHPAVAAVVVNGAAGARRATTHLLDLGHRRIAYLAGPRRSYSHQNRLRGYRQALEARGLSFDPRLVVGSTVSRAAGREAMAELLRLDQRPTAVFAFDDLMAIGALEELRAAGLHVPDDVAVVGFDDIELAAFVDPALTTVAQPKAEMGRLAANRLLDLIEGTANGTPRKIITLTPELIVRASCGWPARHASGVSQHPRRNAG
jgi:LacI family transcriptional regulator